MIVSMNGTMSHEWQRRDVRPGMDVLCWRLNTDEASTTSNPACLNNNAKPLPLTACKARFGSSWLRNRLIGGISICCVPRNR